MFGNPQINLENGWVIPPGSHRADEGVTIRVQTTYSAESGNLTMHTRTHKQVCVPLGNVLRLPQNQRMQHQSFKTGIRIPYEYTLDGEPLLPILCRPDKNGKPVLCRVDVDYVAVGVWDEEQQEWYFNDPNRPVFYFYVKRVPSEVEEDFENLQV